MKTQFKVTGKNEYAAGAGVTNTTITLSSSEAGINGVINIVTSDQAYADSLGFHAVVDVEITVPVVETVTEVK